MANMPLTSLSRRSFLLLAAATAPPGCVRRGRPRIGLALGGGALRRPE